MAWGLSWNGSRIGGLRVAVRLSLTLERSSAGFTSVERGSCSGRLLDFKSRFSRFGVADFGEAVAPPLSSGSGCDVWADAGVGASAVDVESASSTGEIVLPLILR